MSFHDEIHLAIHAHAAWKANLLKVIETGSSDVDPRDVCRDDACTFGIWLFGKTIPEEAKSMDEHRVCVQLHKEFHELTSEIIKMTLNGQRSEALKMLGELSVYSELSDALTQHMKLWLAKWDKRQGRS